MKETIMRLFLLKNKYFYQIFLVFVFLLNLSTHSAFACDGHSLSQSEIDSIVQKSDHWPTDKKKENPAKDFPVLIEVYDYLCGHCKTSYRAIQNVRAQGQEFVVIYRPMGKLGPHSKTATKAALAAHFQGKFLPFNDYLMRTPNFPSEDVIQEAARFAKLDLAKFKRDRRSPQIEDMIAENQALTEQLNIKTVPSFLLDECHIPHSITEKQFLEALNADKEISYSDRFKNFFIFLRSIFSFNGGR